ncbi:hypothetical protein like AT1G11925 [Hibiscus trionum]|uniref:Stigma-specific STIG1-like protein 1 n=1 Tax=Hibiscus trionum TaxID=183268 RepID=A0A9W7J1Q7_HIBTR|nr:hypothetical protein like AT1G11925 [Hibiscus trionum]
MKFGKLVFVSVLVMVLVLSISAASQQESTENYSAAEDDHNDAIVMDLSEYSSTEGRRSLLQKKQSRRVTCKKFPGICQAKGSPGPTCCKKKCVNVLTDRQNCGKCGKKCKHCGGCNNRCGNREFCVLGLCNYA